MLGDNGSKRQDRALGSGVRMGSGIRVRCTIALSRIAAHGTRGEAAVLDSGSLLDLRMLMSCLQEPRK